MNTAVSHSLLRSKGEFIVRHFAETAREHGPPLAVGKANELARTDRQGKQTLRDRIGATFETK